MFVLSFLIIGLKIGVAEISGIEFDETSEFSWNSLLELSKLLFKLESAINFVYLVNFDSKLIVSFASNDAKLDTTISLIVSELLIIGLEL
ncbi:hypothetical protein RhiirA5_352019 [Rhizophagus irregularis]|uniref:Uncharacterized protein n=2 Tax=Rhizophagus irregularis TaxID=588596 RepID=A0A2I1G9D9_9GLOM|nr:hypothetical protein GLOIN_2v1634641 [Rhizophagus irregularis DAOM 181602=DAOM 197198]PKC13122.1 hypothetical protein RhiirA5_352019 [Rhizophagus irregularis]PKC74543.1 hypothetical protein RhiirA1_408955 [Rhizophagus irregularis]PKK80053.1 hypothetical protein RhiirC2_725399 [Rhizophagus irregularis]PKY15884.1 hypothetical protein RhiirB3_402242 [Rhizophagus irregularis]PKY43219.1 hypothetical protein RhiirA4_398436 [Rhizophagus irregularis]|eukprot:XP_025175559.1 hypothetical protein GLOIN_2v1634641 [Rhizophagus irregularis DAOM 181602=DAOM 197198]